MLFKKKEICGRYYTENALLSGEKLSTFCLGNVLSFLPFLRVNEDRVGREVV